MLLGRGKGRGAVTNTCSTCSKTLGPVTFVLLTTPSSFPGNRELYCGNPCVPERVKPYWEPLGEAEGYKASDTDSAALRSSSSK